MAYSTLIQASWQRMSAFSSYIAWARRRPCRPADEGLTTDWL